MYMFERIAPKMQAIRESRGLSKSRVAKMTGLSYTAYFAIEKGRTDMRLSTLCKIAGALGVEPAKFFEEV